MTIFERLRAWYRLNSTAPAIPSGLQYYSLPSPDGKTFEHGIEVLNDDATPLVFVLRVLQHEVGLSHAQASVASALCHDKGGVLIPLPSAQQAEEAAARVARRAEEEAWPLRCRAVSAPQPGPSQTNVRQ
ncbi:MAG: ATP-dependent Clp protease adaptor ClpS [Burkholderiaceae bacterium]